MVVTNNLTGETKNVEDVVAEPIQLTEAEKEIMYAEAVVSLIREQYSADDELAILRKQAAGTDGGEFEVYNNYVEDCKRRAKGV